ncbi:MAG: hypothetical protein Q7S45_01135 [Candidatus Curtissbacteria bacterium]|nr:hypothetical protein [Candidatus Curtissbacteria bacterium]
MVSMWLLATVAVAVLAAGVLFLVKVKGVNPITTLQTGTTQSTPSVQSVSSSDEVGDIQNELESTSFEGIDSDLEQTSKDLNSF